MLHPDLGYINYKYVVFRPLLVLLHVPLYDYPLKRNKIKTHHFSIFGGEEKVTRHGVMEGHVAHIVL
jgi:hypothetical protein